MSADVVQTIQPDGWVETAGSRRNEGYVYFDLLAGVDRLDAIEVVVRLVRPDVPGCPAVRIGTRLPVDRPRLASLTGIFPAAGWHERELAEMFGVEVDGHPDLRPLLRRQLNGAPPLLRSTVLAARVARPWPGAADGADDRRGSRRRQAPPGAVTDWLRDDS